MIITPACCDAYLQSLGFNPDHIKMAYTCHMLKIAMDTIYDPDKLASVLSRDFPNVDHKAELVKLQKQRLIE